MSEQQESDEERIREELLIADLLFGLTEEEQAEYESLGRAGLAALRPFEDLIGELDSTWSRAVPMPMPSHLREKIRKDALNDLTSAKGMIPGLPRDRGRHFALALWAPWLISAACMVITATSLMSAGRFGVRETAPMSIVESRNQLLATATDLIRADWSDGPTPFSGVSGEVDWSTSQQRGFLSFRGMPVNKASVEQYQLWIFDRNQDEKTPIDGGVFDISSQGEVLVPIRAALKVRDPYLFAVTVEKPGGVVVSSRARLPVLGTVQ
ncbi:anti-sigma factor [Singulisphaera rosea]